MIYIIMPELPEIETIKKSLGELKGIKILKATFYSDHLTRPKTAKEIKPLIMNKTVKSLDRHGKYLLINLSNNYTIIFHLRMTGQILLGTKFMAQDKHLLLKLKLNNKKELRFYDFRKFGTMQVMPSKDVKEYLALRTGVDCLSNGFTNEYFWEVVQKNKQALKDFLLNQKYFTGVGNIYADEALYRSKLSPIKITNTLTKAQSKKLYNAIIFVLNLGIKHGGSSVSDYYHSDGTRGEMQNHLKTYSHGGKICKRCGDTLIKIKVAGRGTVYCPTCQQ